MKLNQKTLAKPLILIFGIFIPFLPVQAHKRVKMYIKNDDYPHRVIFQKYNDENMEEYPDSNQSLNPDKLHHL